MTEQIHEDPTMMVQPIEPLGKRHIITDNWVSPAKTLALGGLMSVLCVFMIPVYGLTYVRVLMPICILTAITQISISIIKEIDEHSNHNRNPMR